MRTRYRRPVRSYSQINYQREEADANSPCHSLRVRLAKEQTDERETGYAKRGLGDARGRPLPARETGHAHR